MSFDTPQVLFGFVLYIPLVILEVLHYQRHKPFLDTFIAATGFTGEPIPRQGLIREFQRRRMTASLLWGIFLACIIIALAGPRWGKQMVLEYRRGVDVVFALDLSRSMEVQDSPARPSRLDRACYIAQEAAEAAGEIRLGAAIGKGRGVLAVPLTYDTGALVSFLEGLSGLAITGWGTNLETLIDAATGAFQDGFPTSREIILFSDGEALSGTLSMAVDRALKSGIRVSAVGLGTEQGGPVPSRQALSEPGLSVLEEAAVVSYRHSDPLRNAAERTGGVYIDGNEADAAQLLLDHIRSQGHAAGMQSSHVEAQARWRIFVIAALIAWGLTKVLNTRGRNHG
ncbi:MAG: VWA domain-containing protein [Treponema sp.]|jgi:Ca-activated chloride channel family protein|nr:VWA domain-containing protein [Treponema sp.]